MIRRIVSFSLFILAASLAQAQTPAENLYAEHCSGCHGADRLGGTRCRILGEGTSTGGLREVRAQYAKARINTMDGSPIRTSFCSFLGWNASTANRLG